MTSFLKGLFAPSGAFFGSIAIFATVLVGAYISLYSSAITGQFNNLCLGLLPTCEGAPLNEASTAFRLLLYLGLFLLLREIAVNRENNSARSQLHSYIKSTPSKSFLGNYSAYMRILGARRLEIKAELNSEAPKPDVVHKLMRECLQGVLSLAKDWDGNEGKSSVYRANIMTLVPSGFLDTVTLADGSMDNIARIIDSSKLFLYNNSTLGKLAKCSGILVLEDTTFTVSTKVEFGERDDFIKEPICFPYVEQGYAGFTTQPIIPGAPMCASFGMAQYLHHTQSEISLFLDNLAYKNREFCNRFKHDVLEYYNDIEEAQSILSIPIQVRREADAEQLPVYETIAVMNIYRNKKGIFRDEDSAMNFAQLLEPICYHFGKMLVSLAQIEPET